MRCGADHAIIQRQTKAALGRQVGVDDVGLGAIGVAQQRKQRVRLRGQIVALSDREQERSVDG